MNLTKEEAQDILKILEHPKKAEEILEEDDGTLRHLADKLR